jgi:hypothetical protein
VCATVQYSVSKGTGGGIRGRVGCCSNKAGNASVDRQQSCSLRGVLAGQQQMAMPVGTVQNLALLCYHSSIAVVTLLE